MHYPCVDQVGEHGTEKWFRQDETPYKRFNVNLQRSSPVEWGI